ncbi:MAG: hypothetical protein EOO75_00765 [Myxococcales bacterium]|nr:MAG: hypothetical protein EOO75_00765 [Myxococcales bacterium]
MEPTTSLSSTEDLTFLTEQARQQVANGYTPLAEIESNVRECLERGDEARRAHVARVVREAIDAQRRAQATWPALTDCDCLDQAFARLESAGVVARAHFTCCQNCGHAEIGDEIDAVRARGRDVRGYVFFHHQDTERAVDGQGLLLSYGPTGQASAAATEAIGRLVVDALREAGLQPTWNGSAAQRISVPLRWQRRRAEPFQVGCRPASRRASTTRRPMASVAAALA